MTIELGLLPATATPGDYHWLKFDPSNVPAKRIVGLLACQRDPLLQSFTTRLHAARPAAMAAVPTQKGKGQKKKDKSAPASGTSTPLPPSGLPSGVQIPVSEAAEGKLWEVELEDTIVFPEGGGQPSDTGTLTFTDPNGTPHIFRVEMCIRKKLDSIHLVRVPPKEEAFFECLQVGDEVKVDVDWERRLDQMTIHTAQHLLSAILDTFSPTSPALNTLSWAMHAHPSLEHPYVELPRQLTWAECEEVERRCNQAIDEARRIWIEVSVQGGQGADADGGMNAGGADDERESRGLPKDYAGGVIRHCCIHGTDRNACCGTQLPHLGLIQQLHVIPPTLSSTSSSPSGSATKLFFTAGPRARRSLATASKNLSLAAQALGCNRDLVSERAQRSEEGRKEAVGMGEGLRKELARLVGQVAWASALSAGVNAEQSAKEGADGSEKEKEKEEGDDRGPVIWVDRTEKGTHDFDFLGQVASAVQVQADASTSDGPKTDTEPLIICLSAVDTSPIAGGLLLIQSKSDALAKETKDRLAAELNAIPLSSGTDTPVSAGSKAAETAAGSAKGGAGAKTKVQPRVKGGGAKGRYMCKIDGKIGKREREALRGVAESLRRGE